MEAETTTERVGAETSTTGSSQSSSSQRRPKSTRTSSRSKKSASPQPLNLSKKITKASETTRTNRSSRKRSHDSVKNGLDTIQTKSLHDVDNSDKFISEVTTYQCNHCLIGFQSNEEAMNHLELEPDHRSRQSEKLRRTFECDRCGLTCGTRVQYLLHRTACMKTHRNDEIEYTKCSHCDEIVPSVQDHFELKHSGMLTAKTEIVNDFHPCSICGTRFATLNSWLGHVQNHALEKSFDCLICHSKFYTQAEFHKHVLSHPLDLGYSCDQCPEKFLLAVSKDVHSKKHGQFQCKLCTNIYKYQKSLLSHMRRVHNHEVNDSSLADEDKGEIEAGTAADDKGIEDDDDEHEAVVRDDDHDGNWSDDQKNTRKVSRAVKRFTRKSLTKSMTKPAVKSSENFPCDLCDEVFSSTKQRRAHFATGHQGKVNCIPCNLTFNHRRGLRRHRIRCHGPKTSSWVCEVCGKAFNCSYALSTHRRVHFAPKKHACSVCGMLFQRAENMRRHEARHSGNKAFMCDICGNRYTTRFILQKHEETHVANQDKVFLCDTCGEGFARPNVLKWHIQSECGKSKKSLERPIIAGQATRGRLPGVPNAGSRQLLPYPCPMCRKGFKEESILERHIKGFHTNDERLVCDVCGIRFRTEATLNVHKAIHTSKKYKCGFCDKEFLRETLKQIHEREKHTGEKPHKCKFCNESFARKGKLAAHQLVHYGREIKCDYCDMIFAKVDTKMKHMKKHTNQRPFVCNVCAKAFKEKFNLEIHMRTHYSQKPYSCLKCKKRFSDATVLENHLKVHETEQRVMSYECDICQQLFMNSEDLVVHTNTHTDPNQGQSQGQGQGDVNVGQGVQLNLTTQIQGHQIKEPNPLQLIQRFDISRLDPIPATVDAFPAQPPPPPQQQQQQQHQQQHQHHHQHQQQQQLHQQIQLSNQAHDQIRQHQHVVDTSHHIELLPPSHNQQPEQKQTHIIDDEGIIRHQEPLPSNQLIAQDTLPRQQRDDTLPGQQQLDHRQASDVSCKTFELYLLDQLQRPQSFPVETIQRTPNFLPETLVMQRTPAPPITVEIGDIQNLPRAPNFSLENLQRPQNFVTMENLARPQLTIMDALQGKQVWNLNPGS